MSIVYTLKKLVDPIRAYKEQAEHRGHLEQASQQEAREPPTFGCRLCGYRHTDGSYCPECLADTMQPASGTRIIEPDP